ncbi:MAG: 16S rRNA (guanine(527)-N(7))-methyltransferase RsmG, partial [Bacteroidales bacterium]|nr:16S rRNA (guanine(527)-N(7))-methyltransferase RsmG [Bacteroidales bacterium]
YQDWNSKINVISRKDMDQFYLHHVLHSLAIAKVAENRFLAGDSVLDVGTGGGFPGIPLAILFPEVKFTLCDSIGKKIKVAQSVAEALGLQNVTTVNARAESLKGDFDWVVSRAVTTLESFMPWVRNRYSKGILYLKGGDVEPEIESAVAHRMVDIKKISIVDISTFFRQEWFETKKVIYIAR